LWHSIPIDRQRSSSLRTAAMLRVPDHYKKWRKRTGKGGEKGRAILRHTQEMFI
jgi:hypothetical protein